MSPGPTPRDSGCDGGTGAVVRAAAGATGTGPVTRVLGTVGGRGAAPRDAGRAGAAPGAAEPSEAGRCGVAPETDGGVRLCRGGASSRGLASAVGRGAAAAGPGPGATAAGGCRRVTASTPDQRAMRSAAATCATSSATWPGSMGASGMELGSCIGLQRTAGRSAALCRRAPPVMLAVRGARVKFLAGHPGWWVFWPRPPVAAGQRRRDPRARGETQCGCNG